VPSFFDPQNLMTFARETLRAFVWLALVTALFLPLETLFAVQPRKFFRKGLLQDLIYYFISNFAPALLLAAPIALAAAAGHALMPWSIQTAIAGWPIWMRVLAGVVIGELGFYWAHRLMHTVPYLWRYHAIHHSAEQIYYLVSARAHPFDNAFIRLCGLVPIYVLGIAAPLTPEGGTTAALIVLVMTIWGFFIHSNFRVRLGPLEWLIATPAFHHWHHTRSDHKDHNFASNLPVMDWLFGTYYLPAKWPEAYGTETPVAPSLTGQLLDPLLPPARESAPR
jgi:sterol desaturase/sphingolipid hydroxylase (fatty acid hydroxylase superfamily)